MVEHARVGDADVQALVARRGLDRPGDLVGIRHVADHPAEVGEVFAGHGVERHDAGAVGREPAGRGVADPRGRAGDEHSHAATMHHIRGARKVRFCPGASALPAGDRLVRLAWIQAAVHAGGGGGRRGFGSA